MGDVAMMVPVVASLAKQYPQLRITVLSRPFARTFFNNIAPNVGFMEAEVRKEYHGVHGLNILYRRLAAKHFTAIADMHDVLRSKYLRLRFNLDQYRVEHIDKHRKEKRQLTADRDKVLKPLPTSFDNYADVLRRLGYPITYDFQSIFPPSGGNLRLLPPEIGEKQAQEQWIGIAPFAAHQGKIYPVEKTERVISTLIDHYPDCRIFLFGGGPTEKPQLDAWEQKFHNCINASEKLNGMDEELVLMSHIDAMLTMDSGNMHLASLVGTPVVSIWGATHPYAGFMGWGQQEENILQVTLPCRPCSIYGNKPCLRGDYACLNLIEPEAVVQKIEKLLQDKPRPAVGNQRKEP